MQIDVGIAAAKTRGVYRKKNGEAHNKKQSDAAILELVAVRKGVLKITKIVGYSAKHRCSGEKEGKGGNLDINSGASSLGFSPRIYR